MPETTDHDLLIVLNSKVDDVRKVLSGVVPDTCSRHSAELINMQNRVNDIQDEIKNIWGRLWWIVGIPMIPAVGAVIYAAFK